MNILLRFTKEEDVSVSIKVEEDDALLVIQAMCTGGFVLAAVNRV